MGAKNKQIKNAPVVVLYGGCNAFTSILCSWMKHRLNNVNGLFMSSMLLKDQGVHESKHQDWSHVHERKKKDTHKVFVLHSSKPHADKDTVLKHHVGA